ncbi:ribbon-helix-helix protein, CopG family [Magnetovirga frankeli]|uniref:CopG family ribbon-helix-helix protein n=1 Tax=Magnetovirga frankeli TaxID=947516 RepID=UPI001293BEC8|nr:ribbon-helix-helix protein, CopG family [gamma proteobacterium SS-5]
MSSTMTVPLDSELKDRLESLSGATNRSKSFLAAEAIREYVELNEWQVGEIQKAINEADAEDFVPDETVKQFFSKWDVDAG